MGISDLIQGSIESWSKSWGERLKTWSVTVVGKGIELLLDILGKGLAKEMSPLLDQLSDATKDVPQLNQLIQSAKKGGGQWQSLLVGSVASKAYGGITGSLIDTLLAPVTQALNRTAPNTLLDASATLDGLVKGKITEDELRYELSSQGFNAWRIDKLIKLAKHLFGADALISLQRRGALTPQQVHDELIAQGWDEAHITNLLTLSVPIPNAGDVIRWASAHVYDGDIMSRFGLINELPDQAYNDAALSGTTRRILLNNWAGHWRFPAVSQGFDMLQRGLISSDDFDKLIDVADIPPFFKSKIKAVAYSVYPRITLRQMYDVGIIDDDGLKSAYKALGFDDDKSANMVLYTKLFTTLPDVIARYKNGYIKLEDVKATLLSIGMTDSKANQLIERKVKPEAAARVVKERDLTKAEIIKGLLKSVISEAEAKALLQDMGYDANEVEFIIAINAPSSDTKAAQAQKALTKSDIVSSFKQGLIAYEDAVSRLVALKYSQDDATFIIDLAKATIKAPIEAKQKELTKADITKGVKLGLITAEDGYIWLQDIGYSATDADYLLALTITSTTGSPDTFSEFKSITQAWRQSQGLSYKQPPADLISAEWNVKAAQAAFELGRANKVSTDRLTELSKTLSDTQAKYRDLLTKYQGK